MPRALAILGTGSDVGKSLVTAGLCRMFSRRGWRVAPFKAQNMSLNAFVTHEGGEIGRAQAVQAFACGLLPSVHMNPILLKPESETRCQVVVQGTPRESREAADYFAWQAELWGAVVDSYARQADGQDLLFIEGAGSAAEVNLRDRDLVNWRMAHHADARVLLVADIERGGVFAQIIGTLELLRPEERARVDGLIINKFRGDPALFDDGVRFLEERTGLPILGVIPYLFDCRIHQEDGVPARTERPITFGATTVNIAVLCVPYLSNVTDFLALSAEPDVALRYVTRPSDVQDADVILLPGTKQTIADLAYLRAQGFAQALARHVGQGREVVGICGGYQMLGRRLHDPDGVEHSAVTEEAQGLGYLDIATSWAQPKVCRQVDGEVVGLSGLEGCPIVGYQIYAGRVRVNGRSGFRLTARSGKRHTMTAVDAQPTAAQRELDGAVHEGGLIWGTSVHGLFDAPGFRRAWLNRARARKGLDPLALDTSGTVSSELDHMIHRWADHLEAHLDLSVVERVLRLEARL